MTQYSMNQSFLENLKSYFCCLLSLCFKGQGLTTANMVKFLNLQMPENFAVIYLKFKTKKPNLRVYHQKDASGIANSVDPDQTAPREEQSLIWVFTVCPDLSVRKHRIIRVLQ